MAETTGIDWEDIKSAKRHGTQSQGQSSDGTGASGNLPKFNADGSLTDAGIAASALGTVTSVSASAPSRQSVVVTNPTTTPAIAITDNTQSVNQVFAGPSSGGSAAPTFRALAAADLPSQPFVFGAYLPGKPTASYYIPFDMPGDISPAYPANFANATGKCGANPTSTVTITITDNGTTIGTISVSTGGVVTFATTGGTSGTVTAGHEVQAVFPASPDATFSDFRFTMRWSR